MTLRQMADTKYYHAGFAAVHHRGVSASMLSPKDLKLDKTLIVVESVRSIDATANHYWEDMAFLKTKRSVHHRAYRRSLVSCAWKCFHRKHLSSLPTW